MNLSKYEIAADDSLEIFEFISVGDRGNILKIIKFSETSLKNFYNLAFGDKNLLTGEIDNKIISNNGDSEKVLATIVSAVYAFTNKEKNAWIYATGSTPARTRLYRIGITKYLEAVRLDFEVYGLLNGEWEYFEKDIDYTAFIAKRKNKNS